MRTASELGRRVGRISHTLVALVHQLAAVLDVDADAVRSAYAVVEGECRPHPQLWEVVESWGDELAVLRGAV